MMNFLFTAEHRILRENVAELCGKEVAAVAAKVDRGIERKRQLLMRA